MEDWSKHEPRFRYMMLDRLRQDCDYSLNRCDGSEEVLWAKDKKAQIENMKALWRTFPEKDTPEWLTWEDIRKWGLQMAYDSARNKHFKHMEDWGVI
jgi:hypothetical protein